MRVLGISLIVVGAILMGGGYLYDPYVRYGRDEILSKQIEAMNEASIKRNMGIPTALPDDSDFPPQVYNADRAQTRLLIFGGGATLLIVGSIFLASGSRRRRGNPPQDITPPP
ncbi:MAG TPA: hypothetical protein VE053_06690 [Allosphingosinicella sp.]|nr:hypothetical protein [Allosphingosinicella sp.]